MKVNHPLIQKLIAFFCAVAIFVSAIFLPVRSAPDSSRWQSYLDPSLIMEIFLKENMLYAATNGGILIYDVSGSTFQQFTSTDGLPSNFLTALAFDKTGSLFVGTEDAGVARVRFTPGGLDVSALSASFHGLTDDRITTLTAWGDTIVYGTQNGAGVIISGFPAARFYSRDGLPSNDVNDVLADGDRVWVATDSGVAVIDKFGFVFDFSAGLPSIEVNVIERVDTAVWVGMKSEGVARFNPIDSSWTRIGITKRPVYSLFLEGSTLWVGTNEYLYSYDGVTVDSLSLLPIYSKHKLNRDITQIQSVVRAADGNLYMGLADPYVWRRGGDLVIYNGSALWNTRPNSPGGNRVVRLSFDINESLWIGTFGFGIGKLIPDGEWVNYNSTIPESDSLSWYIANAALLADRDGIKWIGGLHARPLCELNDQLDKDYGNDVWTYHDIGSGGGDGLGSLQFIRAREDPAGNRWFVADVLPSEENLGIYILSSDKTEWLSVTPTTTGGLLWVGKIFDVAFGDGGVVYVANWGSGVQRWDTRGYEWSNLSNFSGDSWYTVGTVGAEFDPSAELYILDLATDGTLWIGTSVGLYRYDEFSFPQFTHITAKRGFGVGLLGNQVQDLQFDREGNLWVGTDKGLNRIAHDDINDIAAYTTPAIWQGELYSFFDQSVISPIVDGFCEALALHPERDILFIGTRRGLSSFDISPEELKATDLSKVYLYPNPVENRKGHTELKIGDITGPVFIEIYSLEGELVHSQEVSGPDEPEVWDLTTAEGFLVASGVYLIRIISEGQVVVKTITVIR